MDDLDRTVDGADEDQSGLSKHGLPASSAAPSASPTPPEHRWRTPERIVNGLVATFGNVGLDPCASAHPAFWFADINVTDYIAGAEGFDIVESTRCDRFGVVADGLAYDWQGNGAHTTDGAFDGCIYVNPPWGREDVPRWLAKARAESRRPGALPIVMCVQMTGAAWWTDMMTAADAPSVVYMSGRPRFLLPDENRRTGCGRYPVALAVWEANNLSRRLHALTLAREVGGWLA